MVCLAFAVNCRSLLHSKVPVQGWDKRLGPLVSHRNFPGDCGICHVADRWDVLRPDFSFDHKKETGFALEGAHARALCLRCHNDRGPVKAYLSRGCSGCHPDPHASSLGLDCERCHNQVDWRPQGLIAEHARTRFPLYGVHAITPCESCHLQAPAGQFRGAPTQCEMCHQKDLPRATTPDHLASGWTTRCERCHTPAGWTRAAIRHDFFPLTGGHAGLQCTQCHTGGPVGSIPSDCYSCHRDVRAGGQPCVSGLRHHLSAMPHDRRLDGTAIRHDFFPLDRGHAGLQCTQCHTGGPARLHPVGLLFLPQGRLRAGGQPLGLEPVAYLHLMSHHYGLDAVHLQPHLPAPGGAQSGLFQLPHHGQHGQFLLHRLP